MPKKSKAVVSPAFNRGPDGAGDEFTSPAEKTLRKATLHFLCNQVVTGVMAYGDLAEYIENKAYEEWKRGKFEDAVLELMHMAGFLESIELKNEENTQDLAEVYLLIGQLYQYAEWYPESIEWLSKSVFANDGNSLPYHCMALSYTKTGNFHNAIRCFEQELAIDEGNYFTYLKLAELYNKERRLEKTEDCLKRLLNRDPENVQGLHRLIRHYEQYNPSIDPGLLRKRLLGIDKKNDMTSAVIRSYHLAAGKKPAEALGFLAAWQLNRKGNVSPVFHLVKALFLDELGNEGEMKSEITAFVGACHSRREVMRNYVEEFVDLFGEKPAGRLKQNLRNL
jgi:tetratricopeptide (TPR) repeat protein